MTTAEEYAQSSEWADNCNRRGMTPDEYASSLEESEDFDGWVDNCRYDAADTEAERREATQ